MTPRAEKLLADMRSSPRNWKSSDLITVYLGFGFIIRSGKGSHVVLKHPEFPEVRATVPQHNKELAPGYVRTLIADIERLQRLKQKQQGHETKHE